MNLFHENTPLKEASSLPGIDGLKLAVKAKFIAALKAEARGDHAEAEAKLEEAVLLETKAA